MQEYRKLLYAYYIIVAAPAPESAATTTRTTSRMTFHQFTFFMFYYGCKFLNVVLESKDGACKQKRLSDIHQGTTGHVFYIKYLNKSKCNATGNQ